MNVSPKRDNLLLNGFNLSNGKGVKQCIQARFVNSGLTFTFTDCSNHHHNFWPLWPSRGDLQLLSGHLVAAGVLIGLIQDRHAMEGQLLEVPVADG